MSLTTTETNQCTSTTFPEGNNCNTVMIREKGGETDLWTCAIETWIIKNSIILGVHGTKREKQKSWNVT